MRVIGGRLGSRRLSAPAGNLTRPTSDRVREALFSALGDVTGARVLDLYAGTGALGIEALSRGAAHATFVEARSAALAVLRKNLSELALQRESLVLALPVERARRMVHDGGPYDLVFIDPPWKALPSAAQHAFRLLEGGVLSAAARILLEHPSQPGSGVPAVPGFAEVGTRTWGDTQVTWFVPEIAGNPRA
jgi:16S rRNA (guanine966-N2)-methyltransferase